MFKYYKFHPGTYIGSMLVGLLLSPMAITSLGCGPGYGGRGGDDGSVPVDPDGSVPIDERSAPSGGSEGRG